MNVFIKLYHFVFQTIAVSLLLLSSSVTYANAGLEWLESVQNSDGSFSFENDISTATQSTAETLITLLSLQQNTTADIPLAVDYLNTHTDLTTENLSRIIIINSMVGNSVNDYVELLISYQNDDGGFGGNSDYASNPLDTALALQALAVNSSNDHSLISWAIEYLQLTKNMDGGYSVFDIDEPEVSVFVTSQVIIALQEYQLIFNVAEDISNASEYLFSLHNSNGNWGSLIENAYATIALLPNLLDGNRVESSLLVLQDHQSFNGDWDNDVYVTALALRALNLAESTVFNSSNDTGEIIGNVYDGHTASPLADAIINVEADNGYASTVNGSSLVIEKLEPGIYTINYSAIGYTSKIKQVVVEVGVTTVMEDIELFPMSNLSVIKGVIRDYGTDTPISGVSIKVNNELITTNYKGDYIAAASSSPLKVIMSKSGYDNVTTELVVNQGDVIIFSPYMHPEGTTPDIKTNVQVYGVIVSASTGERIEGAIVSVAQTLESVVSDVNGEFTLSNILPGNAIVTVTKNTYIDSSISVFLNDKSDQNIGEIALRSSDQLASTILKGYVKDSMSNEPIVGAKVFIGSNDYSTITDSNGYYHISNIINNGSDLSLFVSADSYYSFFEKIALSIPSILNYDVHLSELSNGDMYIGQLSTSKYAYKSYENVVINGTVNNDSQSEVVIHTIFDILDSSNNVISHSVGSNNDSHDVIISANDLANVVSNWYTQYTQPDIYTARLRIYESNGRLIDEEVVSFVVNEESKLIGSSVVVNPSYIVEGTEVGAKVTLDIRNKSNVDHEITVKYKLYGPNGNIIKEVSKSLTFRASEINKSIILDDDIRLYDLSGDYIISITVSNDTSITLSGKIVVLPLVRMNVQQGITPQKIAPGEDSNVDVQIFIEGAIK